jgi:carboxyl-terminal processing protease
MKLYRTLALIIGALLALAVLGFVYTLGYAASDDSGDSVIRIEDNGVEIDTEDGEAAQDEGEINFDTLDEIIDVLESEYVDRETIDRQLLYEAAIQGMLDSLADTGTFYIDPNAYRLSVGPSGSFDGIGATVQQQNSEIIIVRPFEGSPAEAAGIQSGDVILSVDGDSTAGWTVDETVLRIRGPKGSQVTLVVRHLDGTEEELTITRDEIKVDSTSTSPPGGTLTDAAGNAAEDIGYLRIMEFTANTPQEVETVLNQFAQEGKDGLILDLRANPGGLLQETVDTADLFLDDGTILIEVDRNDEEFHHNATAGGAGLDIPVVILMDEYSASGSEVLAAALKDNGRAIVVGETSFGKGTVNVSQELSDGGAVFITIRHWLTPNGVQIDTVGITPDIEVTPGPFDANYDPLSDQQLFEAIEQLQSDAAAGGP